MSIGDFMLAFVGIIIGLGVADLLVSLHKLLRAGRRVKWHWATPALAALMLLVTLVLWWWSFVWLNDIESETIADFLPKFLVLVVAFLMMAAALPDDVPEGGIDLEKFYSSSRIHLWSLMSLTLATVLMIYIADQWSVGMSKLLATVWPTLISISLAVIATLTARMWVHGLALAWIFAVTVHNNLFLPIA